MNEKGLQYYEDLVDYCLELGIEPVMYVPSALISECCTYPPEPSSTGTHLWRYWRNMEAGEARGL